MTEGAKPGQHAASTVRKPNRQQFARAGARLAKFLQARGHHGERDGTTKDGKSFHFTFRPSRRALKPAPGPNLAGIVGRKKASLEGFPYSEAMRAETGTWTTEELNIFLADPFSVVPGTAMGRGRQTDRAARVALIAYLARLAAE